MHIGGAQKICDLLKNTKPKLWKHFQASHTSCEDVGRIASAANCKLLVVNHFVPEIGFNVTAADYENDIRTTYKGNLVLGQDLMTIPSHRADQFRGIFCSRAAVHPRPSQ